MNHDTILVLTNSFRSMVEQYLERISVLRTQIPDDMRILLLPGYMDWTKIQSEIYVDPYQNFAFEVFGESQTRLEPNIRKTSDHVEKQLFGFYNQNSNLWFWPSKFVINMKLIDISFEGLTERMGVMLLEFSDIRFVDLKISGIIKENEPFVKNVPFAWVVEKSMIDSINPIMYAEEDFFDILLGKLQKIVSTEFRFEDRNTYIKVIKFYIRLIEKIENEVSESIIVTESDEHLLQQLLNKYKYFLNPAAKSIKGQYIIKGQTITTRKPDFIIDLDNEKIYVEIEPPFYKPFENQRISSRLQGALNQISDWKQINSNMTSKSIRYIIVIGLNLRMKREEQDNLEQFNKAQTDLKVVTWDWLLENIKRVKEELKKETLI
jgi:hypothetical protein